MSRLVSTPYSYYILLSLLAPALVSRSLFFISSYPIPPELKKTDIRFTKSSLPNDALSARALQIITLLPPHTQHTLYLSPNPLPFPLQPPQTPHTSYSIPIHPPPSFRCLFYDQKMMNIFILLYLLTAPGHTSRL